MGSGCLLVLSIWYRIGTSTDGKPVAYRVDTSRQVSYAEAGSLLYRFYLDIGVPDDRLVDTFDGRYEGGYAAWQVQKGEVGATTQQPKSSPQSLSMAGSEERLVQPSHGR